MIADTRVVVHKDYFVFLYTMRARIEKAGKYVMSTGKMPISRLKYPLVK